MDKRLAQRKVVSELSLTDDDKIKKNSLVCSASETICSLPNHTGNSVILTNTNLSNSMPSNNVTFNKPVVTVTRQVADGKVVVVVSNKSHEKLVKPGAASLSSSTNSNTVVLAAQKSSTACNNRSHVRSVRGITKSTVVSRYQPILPSAVRGVALNDTKVSDASSQPLNAKALLRAAILSGRRKEPG